MVTVIAHRSWDEEARHLNTGSLAEEPVKGVVADWHTDWRALTLPIGQQFIEGTWLHNPTGEDMRADLGAFLNDADIGLDTIRDRQLAETARGSESGWSRADDNDIELHSLSIHTLAHIVSKNSQGLRRL